jgi:large subunit ribosomal protein L15
VRLDQLTPKKGARKREKRIGCGVGSGHGKTATKGHKGQHSRSGGVKGPGYEGGQMPLIRRVPKRGFRNIFRIAYSVINLDRLKKFDTKTPITPELLVEKGLIQNIHEKIKILGDGELQKAFTIRAHAFSRSAKEKIVSAGGQAEVI